MRTFSRLRFGGEPTTPLISGSQVRALVRPPPSLPELRKPSSIENRPFLGDSCRPFSTFPVSADNNGLSGGFLASGLCIQKFRSWRLNFGWQLTSRRSGEEYTQLRAPRGVGPIVDSIRGFRTVGSIPRERRGVARHQGRGANDLRPRL